MTNILEVIMMISIIIYSYLLLYCKRSGFIFGIIASGIMGYILLSRGVFVQAILNYIYMLMYIYSYFIWGRKKPPTISKISSKELMGSIICILVFTLIIGYVFSLVGEGYPYIDSFSSACSITAIFLLGRKVIEHSYIFILSNIASIYICYLLKDYITILSFLIYIIFNIIRIYIWKNELNLNKQK